MRTATWGRLVAAAALALAPLVPVVVAAPAVAGAAGCEQGLTGGNEEPSTTSWAQERLAFARVRELATGRGQTVAVIDSGVSNLHPQVKQIRYRDPANFVYPGSPVIDCEKVGHGSGVAGVIAAPVQTDVGFEGIAPGAEIVPIKQYDSDDDELDTPATLAGSIDYAVAAGADVINISLWIPEDDPAVRQAVVDAGKADVVVVAAAGNIVEGAETLFHFPAEYAGTGPEFDHVLAVGATNRDDTLVEESVRGAFVGIAAPGGEVLLPTGIEGYHVTSGTSFAAPFVSGAAALVRERHPELSAAEVVTRLEATADRPGVAVPDDGYGWGILNPYVALTSERDDGAPLPAAEAAAPIPAPDLPGPEDRTLQNVAYAVTGGLVAAGAVVAVGAAAWRRTSAEHARGSSSAAAGPPV
ncbi:S8 family serine peptidase [Nocardioides litoris]|uniref:S8 family serine peptidase n=1 Tax=Nocardioides litoris TaxID=1926648 RepID=UPI001476B7E8|nr:S8 family serine peptidase [Nocardioides litoris]